MNISNRIKDEDDPLKEYRNSDNKEIRDIIDRYDKHMNILKELHSVIKSAREI